MNGAAAEEGVPPLHSCPTCCDKDAEIARLLALVATQQAQIADLLGQQEGLAPAAHEARGSSGPTITTVAQGSLPRLMRDGFTRPASYSPGDLRRAANEGNLEGVRAWLDAGICPLAPLESLNHYGPLPYASRGGHLQVLELLLLPEYGVDLTQPDRATGCLGTTVVQQAAFWGHTAVVKYLVGLGCEDPDPLGLTPTFAVVPAATEQGVLGASSSSLEWTGEGRVTILCSAPEFERDGTEVMQALFWLCTRYNSALKFGYDWGGSSTAEAADSNPHRVVHDCCMSLACTCAAKGREVIGPVDWSDPTSVAGSEWFPKYKTKVMAAIGSEAQREGIELIEMIALNGGPVSQLEQITLPSIITGAVNDLQGKVSIGLAGDPKPQGIRVVLHTMDWATFARRFARKWELLTVLQSVPEPRKKWQDSILRASGGSAALVAAQQFTKVAVHGGGIIAGMLADGSGTATSNSAIQQLAAVCAAGGMSSGSHYAELTLVRATRCYYVGVATASLNLEAPSHKRHDFWGVDGQSGCLCHDKTRFEWPGMQAFAVGDVVGMNLDCDRGELTLYKNGQRLGIVTSELPKEELFWAVSLRVAKDSVALAIKPPPHSTDELDAFARDDAIGKYGFDCRVGQQCKLADRSGKILKLSSVSVGGAGGFFEGQARVRWAGGTESGWVPISELRGV